VISLLESKMEPKHNCSYGLPELPHGCKLFLPSSSGR
jgi:hypothetical protein